MYTFKDMYYELSLPLGSFFGFKQNIKKTEEQKSTYNENRLLNRH